MIEYPVSDVYLFDTGVDSFLDPGKQGFAYNDFPYLTFPAYLQAGTVGWDPQQNFVGLQLVPEVQILTANPIPTKMNWKIGRDWTAKKGEWAAVGQLSNGSNRLILQAPDVNSGFGGEIKSNWQVPQNGGWAVLIRRPSPRSSIESAYSYIQWDIWSIVIPYQDSPALYKKISVKDGSGTIKDFQMPVATLGMFNNAGASQDEAISPIMIGYRNIDGKICISADWFQSNFVYEENDVIKVPKHYVTIGHVSGPVEVDFLPIKYNQAFAFYECTPIPIYYHKSGSGGGIIPQVIYRVDDNVFNGTDIRVTTDIPASTDTTTDTEVVYKAQFILNTPDAILDNPSNYQLAQGQTMSGWFDVSPELKSVIVKHKPVLTTTAITNRNIASRTWGERVISITGEEGIDYDSNSWQLVLDNTDSALSTPLSPIWMKPYKAIRINAGYVFNDGSRTSVPVFTGIVTNPVFQSFGNKKQLCTVRVANFSWMCKQIFSKGDWPMFDGWIIGEALEWLALKCRIPNGRQQFSGSGSGINAIGCNQSLSRGGPANPLWQANVLETSAWDLMKKIADYIKYDLFFDRVGNLICIPKQLIWNGSFGYTFHVDEPGAFSVLGLSDIELSYQGEDWYNSVYVGGFNRAGGVISTYKVNLPAIYDPSSPQFMGFEKSVAVAYEAFVDINKVEEITDILYDQSLLFPRRLSGVTYYNTDIGPNDVFKLVGSQHDAIGTYANPRYYRIITLSHNLQMKSTSTTSIVAEFVGPIGDP